MPGSENKKNNPTGQELKGKTSPGETRYDVVTTPFCNLIEFTNAFVLELTAPGLKKSDFKINLMNKTLTISSEKKEVVNEKDYRMKEFSFDSFCRSFRLPDNIVTSKTEARYERGILKITLPKNESSIPKPAKKILVQ